MRRRNDLPPKANRRWRDELYKAIPEARETGGTYAENYGRAIQFFLDLYRVENDPADLRTATALADEAIDKLYVNGWFKGHPAKFTYEATDGTGQLLCALIELGTYLRSAPVERE